MVAMRMPKKSEEEKNIRSAAIQAATKEATLIPFGVLERSLQAVELAGEVLEKGNRNSLSDAGVAALTARTAALGAYFNVLINLPSIKDGAFVSTHRAELDHILTRHALADQLYESVKSKI